MSHDATRISTGPFAVLEVPPNATTDEIRQAYLRLIQAHPPERDPEAFERIRDAYAELSNPAQRFTSLLMTTDPTQPLEAVLERQRKLQHVGPQPWLAAIAEIPTTDE